jgi:hypothetical protein
MVKKGLLSSVFLRVAFLFLLLVSIVDDDCCMTNHDWSVD